MGDKGNKRAIRIMFTEAEFGYLRDYAHIYNYPYPAKFARALIRIAMSRLTEVEYVYGSRTQGEDEIKDMFQNYSDWERSSDHAFGPNINKRR
jgi:hypothetical protein|nr:MAG TPA: hypothetical protein [Caudoviricetes sp.]